MLIYFTVHLLFVELSVSIYRFHFDHFMKHERRTCLFSFYLLSSSFLSFYFMLILIILGPIKMFGKGSIYAPLLYGFVIGAFLPIPAWFLMKKFPNIKWLKYVHFPIMLSATAIMPPAPPGSFPSWLIAGFIFNYVLIRYARSWWKRYAYVFSAAMDCGVAFGVLIIFFVLQNNKKEFPTWWGSGGETGDGCPLSHANYSGIIPRDHPVSSR
jgi:hypothetical protein